MTKRSICRILITLVLMAAVTGCRKDKNNKEPSSETIRPETVTLTQAAIKEIGLETETISKKSFARYCVVPAKVLTNQDNEAVVGSLIQGRVCKVFVKAGDKVKSGQELMLLEGLEIGRIKAGFLSAVANLEYHKSNYERQKKLLAENAGAQKNLLET